MVSNKVLIAVSLSLVLLLSGCINVNVDQKLKRSGHYDLDFSISTTAEYKMLLNALKGSFQVDESVKDKLTYKETDTSITYSFKDLNPATDKKLFTVVKNDTESNTPSTTSSLLGSSQETPDLSFINPENIQFSKEFKFPYFEYTLKIPLETKKDVKSTEPLTQDVYISDEANILDSESKTQIMQSLNEIYQNDSVEILIVTKKEMNQSEYFTFSYDYSDSFKFKNKDKQYVLIFASTNEGGLCRISSNIYMDLNFSSKVRKLDTDFKKNCKPGYSTQIKDVVTKLHDYFKANDLESSSQANGGLDQLFLVGYSVEVFGKIVETNGLKSGPNKVRFDIDPSKDGEYTLVFRDFFLASMLGDSYWIYLIVLGVIIVGVIVLNIIFKHKKNLQSKPLEVPIAVNPQLMDYIRRARVYGMGDPQIKTTLVQSGWNPKDVDTALRFK